MTRDNITIRPATLADFEYWHDGPPVRTVRAWVAEVNGQPAALAGFTVHPFWVEAFSCFKPIHGLPVKCIYRHARLLLEHMKKYRLPLWAVADPELKNSGKFLESLGFTFDHKSDTGDVYICNYSQ